MHFDHPLWAESYEFPPEAAGKLLPALRAGNKAVRDEFVRGYMRLALTIVSQYMDKLRGRRWVDDLVSAAMLGVARGVSDLTVSRDSSSPSGFVARAIHAAISDMLEDAQFIRIPRREQGRRVEAGLDRLVAPSRVFADEANDLILDSTSDPRGELSTLEDALETLTDDERELTILRMRREGYTDQEIADSLELSQQSVHVIRQDLYARLKADLPRRIDDDEETQTPNQNPTTPNPRVIGTCPRRTSL